MCQTRTTSQRRPVGHGGHARPLMHPLSDVTACLVAPKATEGRCGAMIITEELKGTSEEDKRLMAERLESENPLWIIVYGVYTRQFVAFPRFKVPRQTIITTTYP